ncbi:MAG: GGDEF domain-containing protein [Marinobacter sp.]|nr:GGDEF domain-containing protein [Marinobacter sp.]
MLERSIEVLLGRPVREAEAREAEQIIAGGPLFIMLPPSLNAAFRLFRQRGLHEYILIGAGPLLALYALICVFGTYFFFAVASPEEMRRWYLGCTFVGILLIIGVLLVLPRKAQATYAQRVFLPALLILTKLVVAPQVFTPIEMAISESYFCMLAVIVVVLALRLNLFTCVLMIGLTALASTVVFAILGVVPRFGEVFFYFISASALCLFIRWQLEENEKVSFLQALLIDHHSEQERAMARELAELANTDTLTGLANRRVFNERLEAEWQRLIRREAPLSLLYLDVDHFKPFNDTYGHDHGDQCLILVAGAISQCLRRPEDLVARYGGEEFVVLLPGVDTEGAIDVATRMIAAVDALMIENEGAEPSGFVTLSIGSATRIPSRDSSPESLLRLADQALYKAKENGRHGHCMAPPDALVS